MQYAQTLKNSALLGLAIMLALTGLVSTQVSAAELSSSYIRLTRMKTGTNADLRIVFTVPAGNVGTEDDILIDFDGADGGSSWTSNSGTVAAAPTASSASCAADTGATALPTTGTLGAAGSTGELTISNVDDLTASTAYCVDVTGNAVLTPSAGEYHPTITTRDSGDSAIDDTTVALRVVTDDEILVTAVVPPTFNFVLDANAAAFTSNLTPGTAQTTATRTVTVNTNAANGWIAWAVNSDALGLDSTTANNEIAPTTPGTNVNVDASPSTEQYVWGVSSITQGSGDGTVAADTAYDATATNTPFDGSGVDDTYREIASSDGTASGAVLDLNAKATISSLTPAATDYTDTIRIIGAGNF